MPPRIHLGDKVRDIVTGFEGIAVARTEWLVGCTRVSVQPRSLDKDGAVQSHQTFDEPQLELLEAGSVTIPTAKSEDHRERGGPRPEISRPELPR